MHGKRRLHHESLESRRLLAASCLPVDPAIGNGDALQVLEIEQVAEGETRIDGDLATDIVVAPDLFLPYTPDLIHEEGNKLFVVDKDSFASEGAILFVFERTDDGTLETVAEVEVQFNVERLIVNGDQVLLFGKETRWPILAEHDTDGTPEFPATARELILPGTNETIVVTVNLGADVEVIRQEIGGIYHDIHHEGNRIVMVSTVPSDVHFPTSPARPAEGLLRTFDITRDGLRRVGSAEISPFGMTRVQERDFYSATTTYPDIHYLVPPGEGEPGLSGEEEIRAPDEPQPPISPAVSVSQYFLGDEVIREVGSVELGTGYLMNFEVAANGQTAIVVRSEFAGVGPATVVDLLDLSGDQIRVFESIRLPEFNGQAWVMGPDYVVLRSFDRDEIIVIDANQSIDLAAENRVRRVEIPARLDLHYSLLQVSEDRLVLLGDRVIAPDGGVDADGDAAALVTDRPRETVLLTISISEARIIADTHLPDVGRRTLAGQRFVLIDAETERFGLIAAEATASEVRPRFLFGHLTESGEFDIEGQLPFGRWLEVDANADRLIVREPDRLLEYDWQNTDDPIITALGEPDPLPTIEAINDQYRLNADGEDHLLDVLANDVIHHFEIAPVAEIVELIGAPEGTEIVGGKMVRIPAAALEGVASLRFEYVISNGEQRSSAVVEIDVLSISEEQLRELVQAVRRRAAEDFGVSVDDVDIRSVERVFHQPLPIVLPDDPNERDLSPGILVTLTIPDARALYAASLEGEIIQVFASHREFLVELGLRAVDENGETLERIAEGDNFWLEFNAKDLRQFGKGVYAAFFDLIVPTQHLVVTGPVEYGPGFASIPGGGFDEGEIDDLGAISNQIEAPGNQRQQISRIGVRAVSPGEITLKLGAADQRGTETLLRGRETEVAKENVRYTSLTLNIVETPAGNPLDADGSGFLSAADALVVINFLGRYGTTPLEDLVQRVRVARAEGEEMTDQEISDMRRYDTNGSGEITALDALVVINGLERQSLANEVAVGEQVGFAIGTLIADDDEDEDDDPRIESQSPQPG